MNMIVALDVVVFAVAIAGDVLDVDVHVDVVS